MLAKKQWVITIRATETEGVDCSVQWYAPKDMADLVRRHLQWSGPIRDLVVDSIEAKEIE